MCGEERESRGLATSSRKLLLSPLHELPCLVPSLYSAVAVTVHCSCLSLVAPEGGHFILRIPYPSHHQHVVATQCVGEGMEKGQWEQTQRRALTFGLVGILV